MDGQRFTSASSCSNGALFRFCSPLGKFVFTISAVDLINDDSPHAPEPRPVSPSGLFRPDDRGDDPASSAPESKPPDPSSGSRLSRELRAQRSGLESLIRRGESGEHVGEAYSALYDRLLSRLFHEALRAASAPAPLAELAAAGSYGRRTLAPRSDLDLRILCESEHEVLALSEQLLYPLWDAGINVGHQVVSVGYLTQLAAEDVRTASCLLDWRVTWAERGSERSSSRPRSLASSVARHCAISSTRSRPTPRRGTSVLEIPSICWSRT